MTSHAAIRESVLELSRRVAAHNRDNAAIEGLVEHVESAASGAEFTALVKRHMQVVSGSLGSRDVDAIQKAYPDFPARELHENVPEAERPALWQAAGMLNMLTTTISMVPDEMLSKVEAISNHMMSALQSGQGGDLGSLLSGLGGLGGLFGGPGGTSDDDDSDDQEAVPRPRQLLEGKPDGGKPEGGKPDGGKHRATPADKKSEFRRKLC